MTHTHIREAIDASAALPLAIAATEPSHIHIPRPSRVNPTPIDPDEQVPVAVPVERALEHAA
jgi:hypothetical protein